MPNEFSSPLAAAIHPLSAHGCYIDRLLGIPDRGGLGVMIETMQQQTRQRGLAASLLVIGVDHMRLLTHSLGHDGAVEILQRTAAILQAYPHPHSYSCWLGGDMFALLVCHHPEQDTATQAAELLAMLRQPTHSWPQHAHVTFSVGAVNITKSCGTANDCIANAENALHEAKQAGRNGYKVYDNTLATLVAEQEAVLLGMARLVQQAMTDQTLYLVYQPIVSSQNGEVLFYEALARIKDKQGVALSAAQFIPAVERFGLSFLFDCHVLTIAITELQANPLLQLAINISASTSENPAWLTAMNDALATHRALASRLIIEITESQQIHNMAHTHAAITATNGLGCQVALDDFGAGFTTMEQITSLPIQIMKLDRSLVQNIESNAKGQALLRALIHVARSLGLRIVAEGVENAAMAAWLRTADVDMQQGYHHGYPRERPWLAA